MINSIIHDVLSSNNKVPIDIQIMGNVLMWLKETMNDFFETGVEDNQLAVLYEANKEIDVAIKKPGGLTDSESKRNNPPGRCFWTN